MTIRSDFEREILLFETGDLSLESTLDNLEKIMRYHMCRHLPTPNFSISRENQKTKMEKRNGT